MKIKGEHEDLIYKNRAFIRELFKIQEMYYDTLLAELAEDGFDEGLDNWLFDYIYNHDDEEGFEEHLTGYHPDFPDLKRPTSMDIYSKPGTAVIFKYPENGYEYHQEQCCEYGLVLGCAYTVEKTDVDSCHTDVYLKEFPGVPFNSVHFANI